MVHILVVHSQAVPVVHTQLEVAVAAHHLVDMLLEDILLVGDKLAVEDRLLAVVGMLLPDPEEGTLLPHLERGMGPLLAAVEEGSSVAVVEGKLLLDFEGILQLEVAPAEEEELKL